MKLGSFRKAAKKLNLSPSVISYHISNLEESIGSPLIYRSTRSFSLTSTGETFYNSACLMLEHAHIALNNVSEGLNSPIGKLKITAPAILIQSHLIEKISKFSQKYPSIEYDISFSDNREDLISNSFDIAIRIGKLNDSILKSTKIGEIKRVLVSPPQMIKNGAPLLPTKKVLENLTWIGLTNLPPYRMFKNQNGKKYKVEIRSVFNVDNVEAMTRFSTLGLGVSTPPLFLVKDLIKQKKLVHIFPSWSVDPIGIFAIWHSNSIRNNIVELFLNSMKEEN